MGLGEYCSSRMALKMRSRVAGATGRLPLIACETVVLATPAFRATSLMVGRDLVLRGVTQLSWVGQKPGVLDTDPVSGIHLATNGWAGIYFSTNRFASQ